MSHKKTLPSVSRVEVCGENGQGRVALCCECGGARYHVWMDPLHMDIGSTLYKNPPRGVGHDDPGYFNTRQLSVTSDFSSRLIEAMISEYRAKGLLEKYRARVEKEREKEHQESLKWKRERRIQEAAPYLLDALTEIYNYTKDERIRDIAGKAIEKAEVKEP